jgi:hypothetical protein
MNISDYCKDALALHQAWMRMGYDAGDIFVAARDSGLLVQLKHDDKTFTIDIEAPGETAEEILGQWQTTTATYNGMPQEWREANFQRWRAQHNTVDMVARMVAKGVYPR